MLDDELSKMDFFVCAFMLLDKPGYYTIIPSGPVSMLPSACYKIIFKLIDPAGAVALYTSKASTYRTRRSAQVYHAAREYFGNPNSAKQGIMFPSSIETFYSDYSRRRSLWRNFPAALGPNPVIESIPTMEQQGRGIIA